LISGTQRLGCAAGEVVADERKAARSLDFGVGEDK